MENKFLEEKTGVVHVDSTGLLESLSMLAFKEHSKAKYKQGHNADRHEERATGINMARKHIEEWLSNV